MYQEYKNPPFLKPAFYIAFDVCFLLFSILYLIGDKDSLDNFLKWAKPVPLWIMIAELWSIRSCHRNICTIMIAIFVGSLGDIFLLISGLFPNSTQEEKDKYSTINLVFFGLGAISFLAGHILNVVSFLSIADDIAQNKTTLREVMRRQPLFIVMWIILMTFVLWSVSIIANKMSESSPMIYVLAVYGSCLVMLVMGGFYFFFTSSEISTNAFKASLFVMVGSLFFLASDSILSHDKFNEHQGFLDWKEGHKILILLLLMGTYYIAQFCIGKGAFFVAVYFTERQTTKHIEEQ